MCDYPNNPTKPSPSDDVAPADFEDPVIEAYKKHVDRSLLRENLKLTVQQRFEKFEQFMSFLRELREAGREARRKLPGERGEGEQAS